MGANIRIDGAKAEIYGGKLHGAEVEAQELRGGAALVLAGTGGKRSDYGKEYRIYRAWI